MPCNYCLLFKVLAYGFSISSIVLSFVGLYETIDLKIIKPGRLIEECDRVPNWELKLAIIDKWEDKLANFEKLNKLKKKLFNFSIILLLSSGLMAAINKIIASILY